MRKLTALLVLGFAAGCNEPKVSVELKEQPAAARYQIVINTHEWNGRNAEAFLVDTQEGRVWAYNQYRPGDPNGPQAQILGFPPHFSSIAIIDEQGKLGPTSFFELMGVGKFADSPRTPKPGSVHAKAEEALNEFDKVLHPKDSK